ncbi:MAG: SBBP repeat-containing protein [Bacteroidia bacterium]|nr:SBBP repeat-containing protein [Bacteroidia bacterium]
MARYKHFPTILMVLFLSSFCAYSGNDGPDPQQRKLVADNPLGGAFYENLGQIRTTEKQKADDVRYYAFFNGATVYFTPTGWRVVYSVDETEPDAVSEATGGSKHTGYERSLITADDHRATRNLRRYRFDHTFIGANPHVELETGEELSRHLNYYFPHCPDGITRVRSFAALRYKELYPNIDLVLYAAIDGLKYEFEVRPGGRLEDIRLNLDGYDRREALSDGTLRLHWSKGHTREGEPFSFQTGENGVVEIASSYMLDQNELRFDVDDYDKGKTLIIDPWSTYYGGSRADYLTALVCDPRNAVVATGWTSSVDFPVYRAWQSSFSPSSYVDTPSNYTMFAMKFDSAGQLRWATYFGGSRLRERGNSVSVDGIGNVIIGGWTASVDFPVFNAMQSTNGDGDDGSVDGVVVKLDTNGMRLWATYFGGTSDDFIQWIGTDQAGNIYGGGSSQIFGGSVQGFPIKRAFQAIPTARINPFFFKLGSAGNLIYSSYYSGLSPAYGLAGAVHRDGSFAFCGTDRRETPDSVAFPVLNAAQPLRGGGNEDGIVAKFDSSGVPLWSTFCGGAGNEVLSSLSFDVGGNLLVTGNSSSNDFPVRNAWQAQRAGFTDAVIVKYDSAGALIWSTYIGGPSGDNALAITTDSSSAVYITGYSGESGFPVHRAAYPTPPHMGGPGFTSGIVAKFDSAGARQWATWLGGNDADRGMSIVGDKRGFLYVGGYTKSNNFPVLNAVQDTIAGVRDSRGEYPDDCFITRIRHDGYIPVTLSRIAAQRVYGGVELTWRSESEVNAYGYIIERRYEHAAAYTNAGWHDIGFVPVAVRSGEGRDYRYLDSNPGTAETRIFYRLRMVDNDGTFEHSPVVEVAPENGALAVSFETAYPSPARDWLTLNFTLPAESNSSLSVHDITGREIALVYDKQSIPGGSHSVVLPVAEWRSGLYLCTLTAGAVRITRRVIVMR